MGDGAAKILLYGYDGAAAETVRAALAAALPPFRLLSAAGRRGERVADILAAGGSPAFAESPVKVLLLAGLPDGAVPAALAAFPAGLPRPLFCVLTPKNRAWTFETLARHLVAERAECAARAAAGRRPPEG